MTLRYNVTRINCDGELKRFVTPERYDPISYLAKGSQGIVCKGWDNAKNKRVVMKHSIEPFSNAENAKRFYREFVLSRIVHHRNVIKLEYAYTPETFPQHFKNMYLIFEEMDLSLYYFRRQESRLFDGDKGSVFIGILMHQFFSGLKFLHQPNLKLIHRDLSSNNILIKKLHGHNYNYILKIADLGLARQLPFCDKADLTKSIGTLSYRAPEICISANYGTSVDLWSSGCILYELITGNRLFSPKTEELLLYYIIRMIPLSENEHAKLPWHLKETIQTLGVNWKFDLLAKELLEYGNEWNQARISLNNYNELLHYLLTFDPLNRITAEQVLNMPLWDCLNRCDFYNPKMGVEEIAVPYVEEYGNNGSTEEWRERLFTKLILFQQELDSESNQN